MTLQWMSDDGEHHSTEISLGAEGTLRALVQSLGGLQWDWQVWESARRVQQRYGLADTLVQAKAKAEHALADLKEQLSPSL